MTKNPLFALTLALLVTLMGTGCENATTPKSTTSSVAFSVDSRFTFGNKANGYAAPQKIWLAGTFNDWKVNDDQAALVLGVDGVFRKSLELSKGSTLKFKLIIQTTASPPYSSSHALEGDWWTSMRNAYDASPAIVLSPAKADVSFEDDGFGGLNAVFTVP